MTGICYETNKQPDQAMLNEGGEVILSAGAIGSPQILELSGIGRGDILQKAGIATRHELARCW